ncbi:UDP-N-acetylglucosamine-transferase [Rhizobium rhizogenes]|uniref:GlcNAc-transferase family protein n=1 Tax=Rhizobium rhizogenes TaxID=359 RepID=UPI003ECED7C2
MKDIFVQIAAYRDPQLSYTLDSLFSEACRPDRLRVRVCWQHALHETLALRFRKNNAIEIDDVDYLQSHGANWARRRVQRSWRSEAYTLIIDSHLRFARHWDEHLVDMLEDRRAAGAARPIITAYPPDFDPDIYPAKRSRVPLKIYKEAYIDGLLVHFAGHRLALWQWLRSPIPAQFLALGFLFADGTFNADIPLDPHIYFFGDEITTGLRAFCHGYDFFHPHRVLAWHVYDRSTRRCHWQDHEDWSDEDRRSLARVRRVLGGRGHRDYPLGEQRRPCDYERQIGLPLRLGQRA